MMDCLLCLKFEAKQGHSPENPALGRICDSVHLHGNRHPRRGGLQNLESVRHHAVRFLGRTSASGVTRARHGGRAYNPPVFRFDGDGYKTGNALGNATVRHVSPATLCRERRNLARLPPETAGSVEPTAVARVGPSGIASWAGDTSI